MSVDSDITTIKVDSFDRGDVIVIRVNGRLVGKSSATALSDCCRHMLAQAALGIVLDLKEVSGLDDMGLGTLISIWVPAVRETNKSVRWACLSDELLRLIMAKKFTTILPISKTVEEAIERIVKQSNSPSR